MTDTPTTITRKLKSALMVDYQKAYMKARGITRLTIEELRSTQYNDGRNLYIQIFLPLMKEGKNENNQ